MKIFFMESWPFFLGISLPAIAVVIGTVLRRIERKKYGLEEKKEDLVGAVGSAMGATVFRDQLPSSVTGAPPTGHFHKLDFSFDEEAEREYEEKYGKYDVR